MVMYRSQDHFLVDEIQAAALSKNINPRMYNETVLNGT